MPRPLLSAVLLSFTVLPACKSGPERGRDVLQQIEYQRSLAAVAKLPPCKDASRPRPDWPKHDTGRFTIQLPPAYQQQKVQGIDSFVGSYAAPGREVGFDYGSYSSTLNEWRSDAQEFRACRASINGHLVKLVTARTVQGTYLAGATWRELVPKSQGAVHLTVDMRSETAAGQEEALAIFRSVEFRRR